MRFAAVDIETANEDLTSICQVGIGVFGPEGVTETWVSYVNPETWFSSMNVEIHGITPEMVADAPTLREIYPHIRSALSGGTVAHHMPFDRTALGRVADALSLPPISANWIDTARVVRRTWTDRAQRGYGLREVANFLDIEFRHHDALEDAIACGQILLAAIEATGHSLEEWVGRVNQPIGGRTYAESVSHEGRGDGILSGETLVFTGSLRVPRREAAALAAQLGCKVSNGVTKKTTMLVVGLQEEHKVGDSGLSSKHRKVLALREAGHEIAILSENDFLSLLTLDDEKGTPEKD